MEVDGLGRSQEDGSLPSPFAQKKPCRITNEIEGQLKSWVPATVAMRHLTVLQVASGLLPVDSGNVLGRLL